MMRLIARTSAIAGDYISVVDRKAHVASSALASWNSSSLPLCILADCACASDKSWSFFLNVVMSSRLALRRTRWLAS